MSAPGPCLVQGAIGPGARDRGLALDNIFFSNLRHRVMRRKGSTRTINIGMNAMMRMMTQMSAMRAIIRANGKMMQPTKAPQ